MPTDEQIQQILERILASAQQEETVAAGLGRIYDAIIAWAAQVPLDAVFAYNEIRLDQERSEEARKEIPSREYLLFWSEGKLREEPVHALNQRLMEREYQPRRDPPATGLFGTLSEEEISAYGQVLAERLSIEKAMDVFEDQVVRYASLVEPEKVRQERAPEREPGDWTEDEAFQAVFTLLYYGFIDPISGHGIWKDEREDG